MCLSGSIQATSCRSASVLTAVCVVCFFKDAGNEEVEEEWFIVEQQGRPQGLYGYRYVDYDDHEAEGNIHITDEDL